MYHKKNLANTSENEKTIYYKKKIGNSGEDDATKYLINLNYEILFRNFSCNFGEIDIIALDKNVEPNEIVFVEVKNRTNTNCGNPSEAVNFVKIRHLYKVAMYFMYLYNLEDNAIRFDVIEVLNSSINHIKKAITDSPL